jgi:hypothetical protein
VFIAAGMSVIIYNFAVVVRTLHVNSKLLTNNLVFEFLNE